MRGNGIVSRVLPGGKLARLGESAEAVCSLFEARCGAVAGEVANAAAADMCENKEGCPSAPEVGAAAAAIEKLARGRELAG